jgi:hypothetical protein
MEKRKRSKLMGLVFTKFPNMQKRSEKPTAAELDEEIKLIKAALDARLISLPFELTVFANQKHFLESLGMLWSPGQDGSWVVSNGKAKTWTSYEGFEGVFVEKDSNGNWVTEPVANTVEGLQWTSIELYNFYRKYASHFPQVPKFVTKVIAKDEAERLQFGNGQALDFPLCKLLRNDPVVNFKSTLPRDIAFQVRNGELEWFKISDYEKAFPVSNVQVVPNPNENPKVVLIAIDMFLKSPMSDAEKVKKIKEIFIK